jgi:hypothetical protein
MTQHCCERLRDVVSQTCDAHADPNDCPDALVRYSPQYDEYGLLLHDGGTSAVQIAFCPWCGARLPESKREQWFRQLATLGIEPGGDDIPEAFKTDAWWRQRGDG